MTRIYLSGPVSGHENYVKEFNKAEAEVRALYKDVEIINPANLRFVMPQKATWNECMKVCLDLLNMADMIYMIPGWKDSPGACMEYGYARAKDMIIVSAKGEYRNEMDTD